MTFDTDHAHSSVEAIPNDVVRAVVRKVDGGAITLLEGATELAKSFQGG